ICEKFSTDATLTGNGAKCYKPPLYRGLIVHKRPFSTGFSTSSVDLTGMVLSHHHNRPIVRISTQAIDERPGLQARLFSDEHEELIPEPDGDVGIPIRLR